MSHIEDIKRTMDEMLRAFHDIVLDGGEGAASRELEKLRERMPVSVELDPESTAEKDQRTKDVVELAMRTSQIEGHVRTLFERYNESQVVPDEFEDIFLARIDQEDSDGGGEYDQWAEVESDTETGGLKTKAGGRTHTSSGESLWEANGLTGVPTGTYVLVSIEPGDNILYCFEAPGGVDDHKVMVSDNDTTPEFLDEKVIGDGVWTQGVEVGDAGDEDWKISHIGPEESGNAYAPIDGSGYDTLCSPIVVCDDMGHVLGWYGLSGGVYAVWYSPWGYSAPSLPLNGTR